MCKCRVNPTLGSEPLACNCRVFVWILVRPVLGVNQVSEILTLKSLDNTYDFTYTNQYRRNL